MANAAAGVIIKSGKSFPRLLCRRVVGCPFNVNGYNKDIPSLINPTQQFYLQRPVLGDGFNFVDFVLGKDKELLSEHWKSSAVVEMRGKQVRRYDSEDEEEADEFDSDGAEDFYDVEDVEDVDDDVNDDDDDDDEDDEDDDRRK